jgi:hypothetical protein
MLLLIIYCEAKTKVTKLEVARRQTTFGGTLVVDLRFHLYFLLFERR